MDTHVPTADFIIFRDAVEELVSSFHCEDGPPRAIAPNGEMYVEIVSFRSGIQSELHRQDTVHFSLSAALADWTSKMRAYLDGKTRIWWRVRPEFDVQDGIHVKDFFSADVPIVPRPQYKIYARLMAE